MKNTCPNCSKSFENLSKFCSGCGIPFITCSYCNGLVTDNQKFCSHCGTARFTPPIQHGEPFVAATVQPSKRKCFIKKTAIATTLIAIILIVAILGYHFLRPLVDDSLASAIVDARGSNGFEKELCEDQLEIVTEDNVKMILSPLAIKDNTIARIIPRTMENPSKDITLVMYDFILETDEPVKGIITLEIPYDSSLLSEDLTAEQCIVGLYYDEVNAVWEEAHYRIDTKREVVIIETDHLSPFGFSINLSPANLPTSGGSFEIGGNQIFTPGGNWIDAPNFGAFYTSPQNDRFELAHKYHLDTAKTINSEQHLGAIMEQISIWGFDQPYQMPLDTFLYLSGQVTGIPEHVSTLLIAGGVYTGDTIKYWNAAMSNLGAAVAFFQLASDMYYEKPLSPTIYSFLKGMTYWKGSSVAEKVFGLAAGKPVAIALVGLFFTESFVDFLDYLELKQEFYRKMPEHKKIYDTYRSYYDTRADKGGAYRSMRDWSDIIDALNYKALTDPAVEDNQRDTYLAQLIKNEIEEYVQAFWALPMEEKVLKLVANREGLFYGKMELIHYEGSPSDQEITVHQYVDKIRDNEVEGMSLSRAEAYLIRNAASPFMRIGPGSNEDSARSYLSFFDTQGDIYEAIKGDMISMMHDYIMNERLKPIMAYKRQANYINRENALKKNLETVRSGLNSIFTLNYIGSIDEKTPPLFAEHIVVPESAVLNNKNTISEWAVHLDKNGNGSLDFTRLAHLQSGAFSKLNIYAPNDINKLDTATPVATIGFMIEGLITNVYLEETGSPIEGVWDYKETYVTVEMDEGGTTDHSSVFDRMVTDTLERETGIDMIGETYSAVFEIADVQEQSANLIWVSSGSQSDGGVIAPWMVSFAMTGPTQTMLSGDSIVISLSAADSLDGHEGYTIHHSKMAGLIAGDGQSMEGSFELEIGYIVGSRDIRVTYKGTWKAVKRAGLSP